LHLEEKTFYTSRSASPALAATTPPVSMPAVIAPTIGAFGTAAVSIAFLGSASHIYITK